QVLIDAGPGVDKFTQAMGRALPPTARSIDIWLITGGRRVNIGAAQPVLGRFRIGAMVIADPDPWTAGLRAVVQQAQSAGLRVGTAHGPLELDGVRLSLASDGRSWLIKDGQAVLAVGPPETSWRVLPASVNSAIFTSGGPPEWQGPGQGFSVIQVAGNGRDGLPVRSVLRALADKPTYRTDRLGTVELVEIEGRFPPPPCLPPPLCRPAWP